ncbi:hypothetical protein V1638_01460 [Pseudarthrobacter sp. J64]|uniref:hypothetical protein n=1 Tax=Pseudarthrobacter sp. J64 TaxID=3116485 RepID=UPI002E80BE11|nr:hypothetical protein [Pseudarthrobacter sp. J64]MEE2568064.1 hypothetical protein [Pseudarthrobacter sp. J64]
MTADHTATFRQKLLLGLAVAGVAAMTACSVSTPEPAATPEETASEFETATETPSDTSTGEADSTSTADAGTLPAKEACEEFNTLFAEYAANKGTDANAYEDVYLKADELGDQVSGDLKGLFASLGVLALDHATATENGGSPSEESRKAVSDAVFANSSTCSAEGVTLRL